jgi:peptidoglycan/xylan/chitin deacetylase (PgdA/CDA1 family)
VVGVPRLSCCLSFDFDALSLWIGTFQSRNPSALSRGEFGAVAIPRILEALDSRGARTTFFIPGHTVLAYPDTVRAIQAKGHEIAHHGWVHESPAGLERSAEEEILVRGLEALSSVLGVEPKGYRSPAAELTENTLDLLLEHDFVYDSSCMATDFYPYYLRTGDVISPDSPYVFGPTTTLIEAPFGWSLSDFSRFEFVWGQNPGFSSPSMVREIWQGEFDYAYRHTPGGAYILTLHPQVIGRGHRMLMFEDLLDYIAGHDGVRFEPMGEYVQRWRDQNPLESWLRANPTLAGSEWHEGATPG